MKSGNTHISADLERWETITLAREDLDGPENVTIESGDTYILTAPWSPRKMSAWKAKLYCDYVYTVSLTSCNGNKIIHVPASLFSVYVLTRLHLFTSFLSFCAWIIYYRSNWESALRNDRWPRSKLELSFEPKDTQVHWKVSALGKHSCPRTIGLVQTTCQGGLIAQATDQRNRLLPSDRGASRTPHPHFSLSIPKSQKFNITRGTYGEMFAGCIITLS